MTSRIFRTCVALALTAGLSLATARPAAAANKEHQQLMADLRILQERFHAERTNLRDVEAARLEESDKWVAFLQTDYESQQAQLELMRTTGQIGRLFP